jgi:hypothetical protein
MKISENHSFLVVVKPPAANTDETVMDGVGHDSAKIPTHLHSKNYPKEIIDEYQDVFPDDLPASLPPHRATYHTIPLVEGVGTPYLGMDRLSRTELKEVERQVAELIKPVLLRLVHPCY